VFADNVKELPNEKPICFKFVHQNCAQKGTIY